jgi:hypothetical protein
MRLHILEQGQSRLQKVLLRVIRLLAGRVPGPILLMSYRRDLFGKHFAAAMHEAMRGPSEWGVGEREIFAAFVSRLNQCLY